MAFFFGDEKKKCPEPSALICNFTSNTSSTSVTCQNPSTREQDHESQRKGMGCQYQGFNVLAIQISSEDRVQLVVGPVDFLPRRIEINTTRAAFVGVEGCHIRAIQIGAEDPFLLIAEVPATVNAPRVKVMPGRALDFYHLHFPELGPHMHAHGADHGYVKLDRLIRTIGASFIEAAVLTLSTRRDEQISLSIGVPGV